MATIDRDQFVADLQALSSEDDATVLAAARAVSSALADVGMTWDDVLRPVDGDDEDDLDDEHEHEHEFEHDDDDDAEADWDESEDDDEDLIPVDDASNDLKRLETLSKNSTLSAETRLHLEELKEDIANGDFTYGDRRYLSALDRRLRRTK